MLPIIKNETKVRQIPTSIFLVPKRHAALCCWGGKLMIGFSEQLGKVPQLEASDADEPPRHSASLLCKSHVVETFSAGRGPDRWLSSSLSTCKLFIPRSNDDKEPFSKLWLKSSVVRLVSWPNVSGTGPVSWLLPRLSVCKFLRPPKAGGINPCNLFPSNSKTCSWSNPLNCVEIAVESLAVEIDEKWISVTLPFIHDMALSLQHRLKRCRATSGSPPACVNASIATSQSLAKMGVATTIHSINKLFIISWRTAFSKTN